MSRIGKKPVAVPSGVKVAINPQTRVVNIEGPKGKLAMTHRPEVSVKWDEGEKRIVCTVPQDQIELGNIGAYWGMTRALLQSMIEGVTKGYVVADSPDAAPAPRNSSGGFSSEGCTEKDPTGTGGCVTKRTLHMYKETKKAGFNMFVGCYRPGGPYEHPKGRACDWSLQKSGFSSYDTDKEFKYGNDLMAFLVRNGDKLGIYYVIWNRKIWFPANGWSDYHGVSAHTDHVHVSML